MTSTVRSKIVQVTNVSPSATTEQLRTLFGHIGVLEEFVLYPGDEKEEPASKVAYIRYHDPINAEVALHLNNTVFLDRALIVLPLVDGLEAIPDEKYANLVRAPPNTAAGVLEFFNKHAEVRCVRMAGTEFDRAAYVEFTQQPSIIKAFGLMGATLNGRQAEVAAVLALETVVRDHAGGPAHVGVEAGRVTGEAHVLDTAEGDHVYGADFRRSRERRKYHRSRSRSSRRRSSRSRSRGRRADRRDRDRDRGSVRDGRDRTRDRDRRDRDYDRDRRREKDRDYHRDSKSRKHRDESPKVSTTLSESLREERRERDSASAIGEGRNSSPVRPTSESGQSTTKHPRRDSSESSSRSENGSEMDRSPACQNGVENDDSLSQSFSNDLSTKPVVVGVKLAGPEDMDHVSPQNTNLESKNSPASNESDSSGDAMDTEA
ncbi:hypothetical protein X801_08607 [Opisthorchis viverrini]|uniref:RRM domain-containing protein n=1 Tax=Opisthorchis viverrini TaxID=6198 RepID=A0A1S8WMB3_OPIVI|nr:hypothetical protein X801_08607 [Opisthorchis viverrini]